MTMLSECTFTAIISPTVVILILYDQQIYPTTEKWKNVCRGTNLADIAEKRPKNISAEYSLLHALQSSGQLGEKIKVELIHTDTFGGLAAVALLTHLLPAVFDAEVQLRQVDDIDVTNRIKMRKSLGGFMQEVASALENSDVHSTCFAPVGGYKVMTSLAYLAGAYMGFPTAYLHEDNQALHEIPAVPIRIAEAELSQLAPMMRILSVEDLEYDNLSESHKRQIAEHQYLFDQLDNLVGLNAFARFLMNRPEHKGLFAPELYLSPQAESAMDGGNKSFMRQQIEELLKKLETPDNFVGVLNHEKTFENLKDCPFSLYKGASQGRIVFRAAYHFGKNKSRLYINRIWTDHDKYEREAPKGKGVRDEIGSVSWEKSELLSEKR